MLFFQWLSELNLFETNATDEHNIRIQRLSTRFYISTFVIILFSLSIYASLEIRTINIEIDNPTIDLYEKYQDQYSSMECSCSDASISYEEFVELTPIYHQICSSDFVTQKWIDYLFNINKSSFYYPMDFRSTASQQFQLLADLCRLSAQGINDNLQSFFQTELISTTLMSKPLFSAQVQATIDAFKINTIDTFNYKLMIIRQFIQGNSLIPSAETIFSFAYQYYQYDTTYFSQIYFSNNILLQLDGTFCYCNDLTTCHGKAGFFGDNLFDSSMQTYDYLYIIDGWYIGCTPIDSLLFSTLKTFYNQTMINSFLKYFDNSSSLSLNFTCLNLNQTTKYDPNNTTLQDIVNSNFIEQWNQTINYSLYFNHCQPKLCSFTINQRFNKYYIITTILGLYGGLTISLKIIISIIINYLFKRKQKISFKLSIQKFISSFVKFNIFRSSTQIEPSDIYHQCWSTRVYLIFISLSIIIVTIYTSINTQTIRIDLINPSLDKILDLQQQTSLSSLQCPCSQISSAFKYLFQLNPRYHEICSSALVTYVWMSEAVFLYGFQLNDFRRSGPIFKILQSFCNLADTTINNALNSFYETQLVSENLLTLDSFTSQMNSEIQYFQIITPNNFYYPLELMHQTMRANLLMSSTQLTYIILISNATGHLMANMYPIIEWSNNNNFSCSTLLDRTCKFQSTLSVSDSYGNLTTIPVPGFYTAAYYVESLLLSDLECLYNQSCVNLIVNISNPGLYLNALYQQSHFPRNVTFNTLANNLFIESWLQQLNYTAYFEQCQPHTCSYIVNQRPTFITVITTVIGLCSGLSVIIRFLSPWIITFILRYFRQQQQQIRSIGTIEQQGHFHVRVYAVKVLRKIREILMTFNIFENVDKPNPADEELRVQQKMTRVYTVVLIIILINVVFFTLITNQTNTIDIEKPTLNVYQSLSNSVDCPCTNLSISYGTFISFNSRFHEVCSSIFTGQNKWMTILYDIFSSQVSYKRYVRTFQSLGISQFEALEIMCEMITESIANELSIFLNSSFISTEIIEYDLFETKINTTLSNLLFNTIPSNFLQTFQLIRSIYFGNGLISSFGTNWYPIIVDDVSYGTIYMQAEQYNQSSCNCATSSTCTEPATFLLGSGVNWIVPGMMLGCYPIESMLQSTLECIYDQNCLNTITNTTSTDLLTALNASRTRFIPINTTKVESIVNELFIEDWGVNISYENYFNSCQPKTCSYTLAKRFNILYSIGILLTIYTGLCIILKLIIPVGFKIGPKYFLWRNRTIRPINIS